MSEKKTSTQKKTPLALHFSVAVLAALAGVLAVYGTFAPKSNGPDKIAVKSPETRAAASKAKLRKSRGTMAAFVRNKTPKTLANITFIDGGGNARSLEDWKGKIVLLNLWATWCAPCRKEMPALDRLQQQLSGKNFDVVALSIDRGGLEKPKKFLEKIAVKALKLYNDDSGKQVAKLKVLGMPTTLLIDREGKEIGRLTGPAEWDDPDAIALIKAEINGDG